MTNYLAELRHQSSPSSSVTLLGRLRPGSTAADATARLGVVGAPEDPRLKDKLAASPLNTEALPLTARASVAQFSGLLAGTVGLLLFAGCTTVGLLLLLRTEARRDEFAMCLALGASRGRLVRGIAVEGGVLGVCGAALSLPIAVWLFTLLRAFQLPGGVTLSLLDLSLDRRALSAAAAAAVAVVLATALIASVFGFRASLAEAIRSRTGSTRLSRGRSARAFLVCGQVAVALFLLSGAGLFARSLSSALSLNAGLDPCRLIPVQIALGPYGYSGERATPLLAELRDRLASNPAVESISSTVVQGGMSGAMPIDGIASALPTTVSFRSIDAHYFATLGHRDAVRAQLRDDRHRRQSDGRHRQSILRQAAGGRRQSDWQADHHAVPPGRSVCCAASGGHRGRPRRDHQRHRYGTVGALHAARPASPDRQPGLPGSRRERRQTLRAARS